MLSSTMMSSGAFAYTKQEDNQIQNFIEDNVSHADKLKLSDVKKALPFMSDEEAMQMLNGMQNMLKSRAG